VSLSSAENGFVKNVGRVAVDAAESVLVGQRRKVVREEAGFLAVVLLSYGRQVAAVLVPDPVGVAADSAVAVDGLRLEAVVRGGVLVGPAGPELREERVSCSVLRSKNKIRKGYHGELSYKPEIFLK
jgi:hypothetical protein